MNIAIIPARGGSKRIKKKNIKFFFKKPMISWAINSLKKSKLFDKIFVSTDNLEIANIAKKYEAEVPFIRSKKLSDDLTPTLPVIRDAILKLKDNFKIKNICCVYPCSPFLNSEDLEKTYKILKKNPNKFVFPVIENSHPIQRSFKLQGNKNLVEFFFKSKEMSRTQDLDKTYHDAGQFYITRAKVTREGLKFTETNVRLYLIQRNKVVDIDTNEDFKIAEELLKLHKIK